MNDITINIKQLIKSSDLISAKDSEQIFELIKTSLQNNKVTILNFKGIKILLGSSLGSIIIPLYGLFGRQLIKEKLKIINIENPYHHDTIQTIVKQAKDIYKNNAPEDKYGNKII